MMKNNAKQAKTLKEAMLWVIGHLRANGYEALLAGGCVRDMLRGVEPHDYDIATNALPKTVMRLFSRTIKVGAQFGVVVVLAGEYQFEVATFRSDDMYVDGRRPEKVVFTDAEHDAHRRDFTINGMFYDPLGDEVIDYVGGQADLEAGIVRAIREPGERFEEDHLRMLRAVRFACRLGFAIEEGTWEAIVGHAEKIVRISPERVAMELEQMLVNVNRQKAMAMADAAGLLGVIMPIGEGRLQEGIELLGYLDGEVSFGMGLACLWARLDIEEIERLSRELRLSNEVRKLAVYLRRGRDELLDALPLSRGRLKLWMGDGDFGQLERYCRAWLRYRGESVGALDEMMDQVSGLDGEEIRPLPLLDGNALMAMGVRPGPGMGELVEALYLAQLEDELRSEDEARAWVKRWVAERDKE